MIDQDVRKRPDAFARGGGRACLKAIVYKAVRIATWLGIVGAVSHAIAPKLTQILLNTAFNMFPDSAAATGKRDAKVKLSPEQLAFTQLMQGIHW